MSQVNCYLVGGPMDGKTVVSDEFRQDLRFNKPVSGDTDRSRQAVADIFEMYYAAAVPHEYCVKQAVYTHASCKYLDAALLSVAASRHAERTLLHECASLLKVCAVSPNTYATAHDRLSLIREIEEHLK